MATPVFFIWDLLIWPLTFIGKHRPQPVRLFHPLWRLFSPTKSLAQLRYPAVRSDPKISRGTVQSDHREVLSLIAYVSKMGRHNSAGSNLLLSATFRFSQPLGGLFPKLPTCFISHRSAYRVPLSKRKKNFKMPVLCYHSLFLHVVKQPSLQYPKTPRKIP